jgi:phenylpyruvate tautomerase PptA (4-oxalocrotonate tautomerase family)
VPMIQCDIRRGRTTEQRDRLAAVLTEIVHEVTGAPIETIATFVRELPGPATYEGGEPSAEYVSGPAGTDIGSGADLMKRDASTERPGL